METFPLAKFANQGFTGIDVSLEISLFEYGLAWRPLEGDPDNIQFIIGVNAKNTFSESTFNEFDCTTLHRDDFADMLENEWAEGFLSFADIKTRQDAVDEFPETIQDAVAYFGAEEIFGIAYETFGIAEEV